MQLRRAVYVGRGSVVNNRSTLLGDKPGWAAPGDPQRQRQFQGYIGSSRNNSNSKQQKQQQQLTVTVAALCCGRRSDSAEHSTQLRRENLLRCYELLLLSISCGQVQLLGAVWQQQQQQLQQQLQLRTRVLHECGFGSRCGGRNRSCGVGDAQCGYSTAEGAVCCCSSALSSHARLA